MKKNKIIFLGTGIVAQKSLEFLAKNFEIEYVITKTRKHARDAAPVEDFAKMQKIPLQFANNKRELDEILSRKFASEVGVVVDYGVIISRESIARFPRGIVNSHFSLLPEWRGADPITFAILSGQKTTGVSLMLIDENLDTGDLIAQESLEISREETTESLTKKLINLSNEMLRENLPKYLSSAIIPYPQKNPESATYSRKITKDDGFANPREETAAEIERKIRAFLLWPKTRIDFLGQKTIVTGAAVLENFAGDNWPDVVACADETFLQITELVNPKSGKQMKTADFLRGLR